MNIIEERISDHNPVLLKHIASFNILCQCRGRNNGFRIYEDAVQYANRLQRVADVIEAIHQENKIDLFALQEAPIDRDNPFYNRLEKNFYISPITPTVRTSAAMVCLFLKTRYQAIEINSHYPVSFTKILGRFQLFDAIDNALQTKFTLMNIHGDYQRQTDTMNAVNETLKLGYSIAGDLNVMTTAQSQFNLQPSYLAAMQGQHTLDVVFIKDHF